MAPKNKKSAQRPFSLLIKPASWRCNLRCDYCFYLGKCALYSSSAGNDSAGSEAPGLRMTTEVLEKLISRYLATKQPVYAFGWQGGEPALMGTDFFRKVTDLQQRCGEPGMKISNSIQTNGTLIGPEMARHFKRYNFLVGISIDGPERIHNIRRKDSRGQGSYADVIKGLRELQKHEVEVNVLVLVHRDNVHEAEAVYKHVIDLGLDYHQYIPCVEWDDKGELLPWSISGEEWGGFLRRIFSLWVKEDMPRVSVRNFDAVLRRLVTGETVMCTMGRNCSYYFVVEHNGDVYPCDFYVLPDLLVGNIRDTGFDQLRASKTYRSFGRAKGRLPGKCQTCEFYSLCAGDCPKNRVEGLSLLCTGFQKFYRESLPVFKEIAEDLKHRHGAV